MLVGLCSKNNLEDVNEVLDHHKDMLLRTKNITFNKSNWLDKATNIKEISNELNIGLDSIVFVDDSSFEVNLIRDQLPEVHVLQVPKRLYDYPALIRNACQLFYNLSFTYEDKNKINLYKQQVKRHESKLKFNNVEDYLSSLELEITIFKNNKSLIPRISQMCQKTNQFNTTTKRYTEGDINSFMNDSAYEIYAFSVADKFGDNGVTGLCIIKIKQNDSKAVEIDSF